LPEEVAEPALSFGQVERPQRVDALTKIEGLPDSLEAKLNALGIYQFSQIAKWTPEQVATVSERLGFQDRIVRDRWIEQAIDLEGESDSEVTGAAKASPAGDEKGEAGHAAAAPGPDEGGEEVDAGQSLLFFDLEAADGHAGEGESAAGLKDPSEEGKRDEGDAPGEEETDALRPEEGQTGGAVRPEAVEDAEDPDTHLLFNDPEMGPVFRRPPSRIDDLTRIKGVARVIEGRLHEMGIFRYQQIAEWSEAQVASVSKRLRFRERIARDQWQAQCRDLLGMTGKPSEERDTA
jgi:predicted flap endonuclease-1-like 5' DNA nuclease